MLATNLFKTYYICCLRT